MYEELVKRLREVIPWECPLTCKNTMHEAADAIEELQGRAKVLEKVADKWCETVPKWIPVTERLPDTFKHVLVNIPGMTPHPTVQEAFLEKNGMWYSNGFRYSAEEITHWMRLPEPPKPVVTNYARIHHMSAEELARTLYDVSWAAWRSINSEGIWTEQDWLDWLKQEAT